MSFSITKLLLAGSLASLSMTTFARSEQTLRPMSLQDCIDYALQNADTLKNARLSVRRQKVQNNQITAQALPRINGTGQVGYYAYQQKTLLPGLFFGDSSGGFKPVTFTPRWSSTIGLSGSQLLFDGGVFVALKARKTAMEVANQAASLTEQGLRYQIQKSYNAVVIGQVQYQNLIRSLEVARDASHDVEVLYNTGFAEKIDLNRSQVQLSNLQTDSIRVAGILETGLQALKFTIGMDIQEPIILTDTALNENLLAADALLQEQLDYSKRSEYQLATSVQKLYQYNLKRYQYAALPSLSFFVNSGYNYASDKFDDLTKFRKNYLFSTLVGLQLNVPIFNGFLRRNQVAEARIDIEKGENNIHALKQALEFQTTQSQTTLQNALLAANSQKRNMELAESVLTLARKKYKAGVGSNLEVNQAQGDLLQSQNNYYSALLDVVNAQADVQKALGDFNN
ncbi:MAG: TolC family protein [Bacteroidetes bacterium]|nr:TolC family protein [Bacteroidota bacterium]